MHWNLTGGVNWNVEKLSAEGSTRWRLHVTLSYESSCLWLAECGAGAQLPALALSSSSSRLGCLLTEASSFCPLVCAKQLCSLVQVYDLTVETAEKNTFSLSLLKLTKMQVMCFWVLCLDFWGLVFEKELCKIIVVVEYFPFTEVYGLFLITKFIYDSRTWNSRAASSSGSLVPPGIVSASQFEQHRVGGALKCVQFFSVPSSELLAAAAAAKSLQSCPTLCDLIDGSPPGSPIPGILQARPLEWVAISFSSAGKWEVKVKPLSRVQLLATPWTAAYQAPPSMGFSRQEYWSGVPLPSPLTLPQSSSCIERVLCFFNWKTAVMRL